LRNVKKIIAIVIKVLIGVLAFLILYWRLKNDWNKQNTELLYQNIFNVRGFFLCLAALVLMLINWGIESFKWKIITAPVENIGYKTATQSVYSGVCMGNLAPGRTTEFLGKIFFFKEENRVNITVLHFMNGMFQLFITCLFGIPAFLFQIDFIDSSPAWVSILITSFTVIFIAVFIFSVFKIEAILHFVSKRISKRTHLSFSVQPIHFSKILFFKLLLLSMLRYLVFVAQFIVLLNLFSNAGISLQLLYAIALYFFVTSMVPMVSFLEAAIRTAIALVVFDNSAYPNYIIAFTCIVLWTVNLVLPSLAGYYFLVRRNFNFKWQIAK
jgi:voltage-gated potassium channel Kch